MLTDVDGIQRDFGTETATRIERLTPQQARQLDLPAGSMRPKARAAAAATPFDVQDPEV